MGIHKAVFLNRRQIFRESGSLQRREETRMKNSIVTLLLLVALMITACGNPVEPEPEPEPSQSVHVIFTQVEMLDSVFVMADSLIIYEAVDTSWNPDGFQAMGTTIQLADYPYADGTVFTAGQVCNPWSEVIIVMQYYDSSADSTITVDSFFSNVSPNPTWTFTIPAWVYEEAGLL